MASIHLRSIFIPDSIRYRKPTLEDASPIDALVRSCPPLDTNSRYLYLLLCHHFADTCIVALQGDKIVGFVSGYLPPTGPDFPIPTDSSELSSRLFVWQVAVHPHFRGKGIATQMLLSLLEREACRFPVYLETTIGPSNQASQHLFESLAQHLGAAIQPSSLFSATLFGDQQHEEEVLFRIGPIDSTALQARKPTAKEVTAS